MAFKALTYFVWLCRGNQAIVRLNSPWLLNINSVFVLLLLKQTFYIQREKYNLLTMGASVAQSVGFTASGLCIEAIQLN